MYDVVIIGAGIVGCCTARELSKYNMKVCVLEKGADVAWETTRANSAIVHAGYDAKPGTLKAALNVKGNSMMEGICSELHVPFKRTGSLVLAFSKEEIEILEELLQYGIQNGVPGLEIIDRERLQTLEPNIAEEAVAALYAPSAGIVGPYELAAACAENAAANGVEFRLETRVEDIQKGGTGFRIITNRGELEASYVINAAGLGSDDINNMLGGEEFTLTPRKGEYCLFDKNAGNLVNMVIFQTPTKMGKGVLVTPTVDGNLLIGPSATDIKEKGDTGTTRQGIEFVIQTARKSVPGFKLGDIIHSFAGIRATPNTGDFIIRASNRVKGLISAAGIESPGLTAAPAIAEMVRDLLGDVMAQEGRELTPKLNYAPGRAAPRRFRDMSHEERAALIAENPLYGRIICRCETVTEGEIVDAIRRPVGARNLDAVKRRSRAGMGRCQGGFCTPRVVEILSRELGVSPTEITKLGGNSKILLGKKGDNV